MIDFGNVDTLIVPEGEVAKVIRDGAMIWKRPGFEYVSLGDSIAAGHAIDDSWEKDYGYESQYGENGNAYTEIVSGCYTDVIKGDAVEAYGETRVTVTSYAHSGDTVADLISKLSHEAVRESIANADAVTICIGANDVLQPAFSHLDEYISAGDSALSEIAATVDRNIATLGNDSSPASYRALFDKLNGINPNARYVFTTVYNPYKFLWLDESRSGFFGPLLSTVPEMNIDVDGAVEDAFNIDDLGYYDITKFEWVSIELNFDLDGAIKDGLLGTPAVRTLFSRVNGLGDLSERFVTALNDVLVRKVNAYKSVNPNFSVADAKAVFDTYPDRPVAAEVHYNDLVNVEYTRGYDTAQMDWGRLWEGSDAATFWGDLSWKYLTLSNAVPSLDVTDYVSFDINGFAVDLVAQVVEKVIAPDIDPHPEPYGHMLLARSFETAMK